MVPGTLRRRSGQWSDFGAINIIDELTIKIIFNVRHLTLFGRLAEYH